MNAKNAWLLVVGFTASAALAETPAKPISVAGMPESQIRRLPDGAVVEIAGKTYTLGKIRSDYAARWQAEKARNQARKAAFASLAAAELRRLSAEADAHHQKRLDQSKQLVAGEIAKWKASQGGVGDPHKPSSESLESRAAALKRREAAAKTAAEWLALEGEARALLAQANR